MKALAGREIIKSKVFDLSREAGSLFKACTAGSRDVVGEVFSGVEFSGGLSSYQLRFEFESHFFSNGCSARICLNGWDSVEYVAVGYTIDGNFIHVKVPNPAFGCFFDVSCAHGDLIFLIQNGWSKLPAQKMSDLKVYVKGVPGAQGGCNVQVQAVALWLEAAHAPVLSGTSCDIYPELLGVLTNYWKQCFRAWDGQSSRFLCQGDFPVYGDVNISWGIFDSHPHAMHTNNTYRFSWHALHSVQMLVVYYVEKNEFSALAAAKGIMESWLDNSFYTIDNDKKYTWYDHGVAERLTGMVALWAIGCSGLFDARFLRRLEYAIFKHMQLLESEAFYASHQPYRYHNHAWFQDIALIASAICFQHLDAAEAWLEKGLERLKDQLANLIHRELGYAVFVENSIGYHQGVQRLVGFAGQLETLAGRGQNISTIANELDAWSQEFRYPDGRSPAQGDTFRQANPSSRADVVKPESWSKKTLRLPLAGYGVAKGGDCNCPWMFGLLGTNLNATHKHEDDLSFFLWLDGVEWLVDPSFMSHEYKDEIPAYLRSAKAHNMLHVEGVSYNYKPNPDRVTLSFDESVGDSQLLAVIGRNRSCVGYEIVRDIRCNEINGLPQLVCTDLFHANAGEGGKVGEAIGVLTFHFGDGVQLALDKQESQTKIELSHPASSKKLILTIVHESESEARDSVVDNSVCGLGFMQHIASQALRVRFPVSKKCRWTIDVK